MKNKGLKRHDAAQLCIEVEDSLQKNCAVKSVYRFLGQCFVTATLAGGHNST